MLLCRYCQTSTRTHTYVTGSVKTLHVSVFHCKIQKVAPNVARLFVANMQISATLQGTVWEF